MALQKFGKLIELKAAGGASAAPSGTVGIALSGFRSGRRGRFMLKLTVTATGALTATPVIHGRMPGAGAWGRFAASRQPNGGTAISATDSVVFYHVVEDMGAFERLYLECALTGIAASAQADLIEISE